jgi:hypothetical protein
MPEEIDLIELPRAGPTFTATKRAYGKSDFQEKRAVDRVDVA